MGRSRVERVHVLLPDGKVGKYAALFTRDGVRLSDTRTGATYAVNLATGEAKLLGERPGTPQAIQVSKGGLDKIRGIRAANGV